MSGDVFGNGMLLSEHIRLVAAFDHRHIFLDPNPDAATSFAERQRLFDAAALVVGRLRHVADPDRRRRLPAHAQVDPDHARRSRARSASRRASRKLTPDRADPRDPASRRSTCSGTAASAPTSRPRPSRNSTPATRPTTRCAPTATSCAAGSSARAATSASPSSAAIEYARAGGRINTDAIDNSAGVDTSDHEVNLKILLDQAVAAGQITARRAQRAAGVGHRRRRRARAARQLRAERAARHGPQAQPGAGRRCTSGVMQLLEDAGELDRAIEFLPSDKEIGAREADGNGLVSPENAVLVAYVEDHADAAASSESTLPDEPWFQRVLAGYFPPRDRRAVRRRRCAATRCTARSSRPSSSTT